MRSSNVQGPTEAQHSAAPKYLLDRGEGREPFLIENGRRFEIFPRWNYLVLLFPVVSLLLLIYAIIAITMGQWAYLRQHVVFLTLLFVAPLLTVFPFLKGARSITFYKDRIHFELWRGEVLVPARATVSLADAGKGFSFTELRFRGGRVRFRREFTGFHEVVLGLRERNPSLQVEGF